MSDVMGMETKTAPHSGNFLASSLAPAMIPPETRALNSKNIFVSVIYGALTFKIFCDENGRFSRTVSQNT
jgi:hypothetical protein